MAYYYFTNSVIFHFQTTLFEMTFLMKNFDVRDYEYNKMKPLTVSQYLSFKLKHRSFSFTKQTHSHRVFPTI